MSKSTTPRIKQDSIPGVKELLKLLGYDNSPGRPLQALKQSTKEWRKQYVVPHNGVFGKDLTVWRDPQTQNDLARMAKDYLDQYGKKLWPSKGNDGHRPGLEYPKHWAEYAPYPMLDVILLTSLD